MSIWQVAYLFKLSKPCVQMWLWDLGKALNFEAMLPFAEILPNTVIGQCDELSLPPVHEWRWVTSCSDWPLIWWYSLYSYSMCQFNWQHQLLSEVWTLFCGLLLVPSHRHTADTVMLFCGLLLVPSHCWYSDAVLWSASGSITLMIQWCCLTYGLGSVAVSSLCTDTVLVTAATAPSRERSMQTAKYFL